MSATKPNCYVASPYGFAESTKQWYYSSFLPALRDHVTVIDPWSVNVAHIANSAQSEKPKLWIDLGDQCYDTISNEADLVVAGLDQEPPDIGTVSEVVWAAAHNIPVIGYRGDGRTSGEEGLPYNLMVGAAIRRSGGIAVASLVEVYDTVERYAAQITAEQS